MVSQADIDKAKELTEDFLKNLEFNYESVEAELLKSEKEGESEEEQEDLIKVDIKGEELSYLIGRFGKTMFAFQHLINIAFNANREVRLKVIIDINKYREKRERELRSYAERAMIEVKESKLPMSLPPMKPAERRIIHLALKEEQGIITTSEGEEPNRYVVIKPE